MIWMVKNPNLEVYAQVLILELLFRLTPSSPKEKRGFVEEVGLDRDFLNITREHFPTVR
jgi:hypothetical protein